MKAVDALIIGGGLLFLLTQINRRDPLPTISAGGGGSHTLIERITEITPMIDRVTNKPHNVTVNIPDFISNIPTTEIPIPDVVEVITTTETGETILENLTDTIPLPNGGNEILDTVTTLINNVTAGFDPFGALPKDGIPNSYIGGWGGLNTLVNKVTETVDTFIPKIQPQEWGGSLANIVDYIPEAGSKVGDTVSTIKGATETVIQVGDYFKEFGVIGAGGLTVPFPREYIESEYIQKYHPELVESENER